MTPVFTTERLDVYGTSATSGPEERVVRTPTDGEPRKKFTACVRGDATRVTVGHAVVWDRRHKANPILFRLYCEWMETDPSHQREGYGRELYEGIERHLGELMYGVPMSEGGRKLLARVGRPVDPLADQAAQLNRMIERVVQEMRLRGRDVPAELLTQQGVLGDARRPGQEQIQAVGEINRILRALLMRSTPGTA